MSCFYTIIHSYVENQYMLEEQKILEIQAKEYSQTFPACTGDKRNPP